MSVLTACLLGGAAFGSSESSDGCFERAMHVSILLANTNIKFSSYTIDQEMETKTKTNWSSKKTGELINK